MIHTVIPVGPLQCNCSIIGDESTHEGMVIDPGDQIDEILAIVNQHGLQVKQIVKVGLDLEEGCSSRVLKSLTNVLAIFSPHSSIASTKTLIEYSSKTLESNDFKKLRSSSSCQFHFSPGAPFDSQLFLKSWMRDDSALEAWSRT